ncbi:hypothetical protein CTO_1004 [Chlamydia trachomatis A2497]|uniref:Uncharacterized protein n=1 Tax=Chlamydia trachomatis serovar A (strain A2497) TaxID=580047 RepID=G4NNR3_CHLT4|nr:hypothetical protein CTO_1004 [Chlamydia trachomatis A2497]
MNKKKISIRDDREAQKGLSIKRALLSSVTKRGY